MSGNVFPRWAIEGGRAKALERMADADLRARAREHLDGRIASLGRPGRLIVASYPPNRGFEGSDLPKMAGPPDGSCAIKGPSGRFAIVADNQAAAARVSSLPG